jgi:hypothetical protein
MGGAAAVGWWIWMVSGGCDRGSEVRCGWQPVLAWVVALVGLGAWLAGIGIGILARRLAGYSARGP